MKRETRTAPVMADVARVAGVSHQTVSRVINGSPNIKPSTRDRVLAAIGELGYRPNTAARALVTRRTSVIGIIASETGLFGPTSIQRNVEEAARSVGYFTGAVSLREFTAATLTAAIDHILRQGAEGIVLIAAKYEALDVINQQDFGVPVVVVEGDDDRAALTVGVDQHRGAHLATSHLISLGHERIAHVRGPRDWTEADARAQGWRDAITEAGLEPGPEFPGDWTPASGYAAGQALLADRTVSAVFLANDQMTTGLLLAAHEAGVVVPDDLSVVGFDDSPEAAYLIPPLTTVRQDFPEVGRRAISLLDAAITGTPTDVERSIAPELVVRSSTKERHHD